jgi:hypothetical protein
MTTNGNSKIGTPHAQYAPPSDGPFMCIVCRHFKQLKGTVEGNCDHPDVKEDAEAGFLPMVDDKPVVHHEGCCSYFNKAKVNVAQLAGVKS